MAREPKRRKSKEPRHENDPTLEAIQRAQQRDLAEHAVDMAEQAVEADIAAMKQVDQEQADSAVEPEERVSKSDDRSESGGAGVPMEKIDSATGYVDSISHGYAPLYSHAEPITSGDTDHLAEIEAGIANTGSVDIEAASEEMAAPQELTAQQSPWIFPKLEIPATRRRSGIDEAQAFFEFTRRFAAPQQQQEEHGLEATIGGTELQAQESQYEPQQAETEDRQPDPALQQAETEFQQTEPELRHDEIDYQETDPESRESQTELH